MFIISLLKLIIEKLHCVLKWVERQLMSTIKKKNGKKEKTFRCNVRKSHHAWRQWNVCVSNSCLTWTHIVTYICIEWKLHMRAYIFGRWVDFPSFYSHKKKQTTTRTYISHYNVEYSPTICNGTTDSFPLTSVKRINFHLKMVYL